MHAFTLSRAQDPAEAVARHRESDGPAAYVAGGTTLVDLMKLGVMQPRHVIDVHRLELARITPERDGGLRLGANARNSDVAWHHDVRRRYPVLAEAILSGASPQVRNMATIAGNLLQRTRCPYFRDNVSACNKRAPGSGCAARTGFNRSHAVLGGSDACVATHPSDLGVALAALDARVVVHGASGERTLPLVDLHLEPGGTPEREHALEAGELITAVVLPPPLPHTRSWYVKARERDSFAFALAAAAVVLQFDGATIRDARVALGGVATKPWRAPDAETALRGQPATAATFTAAAEAALAEARPLRDNAFKIPLAQRVLLRALTLVAQGQPEVRQT
jgi:xanthine dehydrogenase YagS FAD-binding subunit